jgi:hypothetical protein
VRCGKRERENRERLFMREGKGEGEINRSVSSLFCVTPLTQGVMVNTT